MASFPKVEEICPSCKEVRDVGPRKLRPLGTLERSGAVVAACDHCDGGRIFEIFDSTGLNEGPEPV